MEQLANVDIYFRFIVALGLVFVLIAFAAWVARMLGFSTPMKFRGQRQRRLSLVDAIAIDAKRRLILISRDETEHLICIGGDNDFLVEANIKHSVPFTQDKKLQSITSKKMPKKAAS
ncbi:MAG: hypothetical protein ACPGXY_02345 [Alphaproteobacteria bacterium]